MSADFVPNFYSYSHIYTLLAHKLSFCNIAKAIRPFVFLVFFKESLLHSHKQIWARWLCVILNHPSWQNIFLLPDRFLCSKKRKKKSNASTQRNPRAAAVQLRQSTVGETLSSCCRSPPAVFTATSSRCHSTAKLCNTHLNMVLVRPGGLAAKELSSKSTSDGYRVVFPPDPFWGPAGVCFKTLALCWVFNVCFFLPTKLYPSLCTLLKCAYCTYLLGQLSYN